MKMNILWVCESVYYKVLTRKKSQALLMEHFIEARDSALTPTGQ